MGIDWSAVIVIAFLAFLVMMVAGAVAYDLLMERQHKRQAEDDADENNEDN